MKEGRAALSLLEWGVAALVVLLGSGLQAATGMGLALLVAPVLMWITGSGVAITTTVVLNLVVTLVLLPREHAQARWSSLRPLLVACLLGIPVGFWIFHHAELRTLKLLAGISVSVAGVQLLLRARGVARAVHARPGAGVVAVYAGGGGLAGVMTGCLGMPGPALTWAMGHLQVPPSAIRANLRILFAVAYAVTLASHLLAGVPTGLLTLTAGLLPALAVGAVLGQFAKRWLGDAALRLTLEVLLLVMGLSLLVDALRG